MSDTVEQTTREFDLGDILSITHQALVSPRHVEGVYDILDYMTGESLMTHQLPRAGHACEGPLLEQHPQLRAIPVPSFEDIDRSQGEESVKAIVMAWLDARKAEYGDTLPVTPLADWHHIDPLQELAEYTERPDRIIAVQL